MDEMNREATEVRPEPITSGLSDHTSAREPAAVSAPEERPGTKEPREAKDPTPNNSLRSTLEKKLGGEKAKPAAPTTPAPEPVLPPGDMSAKEKEMFSQLPPEAQAYLSRRSYETRADYSRKTQALSEREKSISDILSVIDPIKDEYIRNGISVPDLVRRTLAWDKALKNNPVQAAKEYLEAYGIDPRELSSGTEIQAQAASQGQYLTPEQAEAIAEQKINLAFEKKQQEALLQNTWTDVQSFLSAKPLFRDPGTAQQIEAEMAPIASAFKQQNPQLSNKDILEKAYQVAVAANPAFSVLVQKLDAKPELERRSADAERALQASRSISGGPGSGTPKLQAKNMRENLRLRMNGVK